MHYVILSILKRRHSPNQGEKHLQAAQLAAKGLQKFCIWTNMAGLTFIYIININSVNHNKSIYRHIRYNKSLLKTGYLQLRIKFVSGQPFWESRSFSSQILEPSYTNWTLMK